jgi:outer membrane murein-binding lipoprotein Lpp
MKNVQKFVIVIVLITVSLFASGQSNADIKQILSKPETIT